MIRRVRLLVAEWRWGREESFPVCCKARYLLDVLLGRDPAWHRGRDLVCPCRGYVACGIRRRLDADCLACPKRAELDWSGW